MMMDSMDAMDGQLDMSAVELATTSMEPYVLAWPLGQMEMQRAQCCPL